MKDATRILKELRAAMEQERQINLHQFPLQLDLEGEKLIVAGEVESVPAKKLVLEYAASLSGAMEVVDNLLVKPSEPLEDGSLSDLVFEALLEENAFNDVELGVRTGTKERSWRGTPRAAMGRIEVVVAGGVVTLEGEVESYSHKALAGVLAWWRRGTRDVRNQLTVMHPMEDPDGEMTDALRMVLEKDVLVDAGQIGARCRDFTAVLQGLVKTDSGRAVAENDAWCLFGIRDVRNELKVMQ